MGDGAYVCDVESVIEHEPLLKPESINEFIFYDNFNILCLNARSLVDKFDQFEILLSKMNTKFSLIVVTESWFLEHEFINQYNLEGYNIFHDSRNVNRGGGVCAYVSQKFEARVEPARLEGAESLLVEMWYHGSRMFSALCVYRTPSGELSAFLGGLGPILESLPSGSVVLGDINIDLNPINQTFNDKLTKDYINILNSSCFTNTILSPTRYGTSKNSIIDHVLINTFFREVKSCTVDFAISDHQPCVVSIKTAVKIKSLKQHGILEKVDYGKLNEMVCNEDWRSLLNIGDACACVGAFVNTMSKHIQAATTSFKISKRKQSFIKPWMTGQLFELITKRKQMHDKVKKQPYDSKLKTEYSKFRNFVTSEISAAKRKFYQCKFEDCKGNNNDKWKFINNLLNKKNYDSTPTSLDDNGEITSDPTKICNIFNDYFVNIGTKLANELPECAINFKSYLPTIESNLSFKFEEIDTTEIVNIIRNLNSKKASGYDQITTRSIKENILVLAPVLTELVNMMFRESVFPDCLKVAKVIPLFKKGSKSNPTNYRPISILPILSKITEKVMSHQIRLILFFLRMTPILFQKIPKLQRVKWKKSTIGACQIDLL